LVPDVCAKFRQNQSKIATVSVWDIGHQTLDTASDFIFCPMLLCIALNRQQCTHVSV